MPDNAPHNALRQAMNRAEAEGRAIDWDVIAPPRPAVQAPVDRLTVTASHGVRWAAEVGKWRVCLTKGVHPTTGRAHDRTEAMHGARFCQAMGRRSRTAHLPQHDRPLAGEGLTSYRAQGRYGWIMIGATDPGDALREARRSSDVITALQVWNGVRYRPVSGFAY